MFKKLTMAVGLSVGLVASEVKAANPLVVDLLRGNQLMITNGTTELYNGVNYPVLQPGTSPGNNTNSLVAYGTNIAGNSVLPLSVAYQQLFYSMTNTYCTNFLTGNVFTNPITTYPKAWHDVAPVPSDMNGNAAAASFSVVGVGTTASGAGISTNSIEVTVQKLVRLYIGTTNEVLVPGTTAFDRFVFAVALNGTNTVALTTNIPTTITQGAQGFRVTQIKMTDTGVGGATPGFVQALTFNAMQP